MNTQYYVCRDCHSEFEMLVIKGLHLDCLSCGSERVKMRKNAKINCTTCCTGCPEKSTCEAWKD